MPDWKELVREITAIAETVAPPPAPAPIAPPSDLPLGYALSVSAIESPDVTEGVARGALRDGAGPDPLLEWASRALEGRRTRRKQENAAAAVSAVIREVGYEPVLAWAEASDSGRSVAVLELPDELEERGLYAVPLESYILATGIERRFKRDYPYLRPALTPRAALGEPVLFRAEAVPALAQERAFLTAMETASTERYENVILPMSRIPGVNVLVLAALLLNELLDPMEVLGWIGGDINNLPRAGTPDRPEDIITLPAPGDTVDGTPAKYMIFSDTHRDAPQDATFRLDHFSRNRAMYLKALEYCDAEGYTVIENGDCEEVWYVPSFDPQERQSHLDRFTDIVQLHGPVYKKLKSLQAKGRYYRSIGNHDSYLWEDADLVAWRAANNFAPIHGGFVIPACKTMDDLLPHIGLSPEPYSNRADILVVHGHHFDFWNCDEHNRLGKFITNAVGVPGDALDSIIYDYLGVDRLGHPLLEFWDVLTRFTPWDNWPPEDEARRLAEVLEQRPLIANITQDSIVYSETFAAAMAVLMRSGPPSLSNFHVLLCVGHTHNPQSRPWVPYLERFNPWREREIFGIRVFQNLFAFKTRYLNSGTAGWWERLIWALEITEEGQPRLVYWAPEDASPVVMDWELDEQGQLPGSPLPGLWEWVKQYLVDDVVVGLQAALALLRGDESSRRRAFESLLPTREIASSMDVEAIDRSPKGGPITPTETTPELSSLARLLDLSSAGIRSLQHNLPLTSAAAVASTTSRAGGPDDRAALAAMVLASRQDPGLRGADPRAWPFELSRRGAAPPPVPASAAVSLDAWPLLLTGSKRSLTEAKVDPAAALRGLFWSYARDLVKGDDKRAAQAPMKPVADRGLADAFRSAPKKIAEMPLRQVGLPTASAALGAVERLVRPVVAAARERLAQRIDAPRELQAEGFRGRVEQEVSRRLAIHNHEAVPLRGRVALTDWYGDQSVVDARETISFDPAWIDVAPAASRDVTANVHIGSGFRAGSSYRAMLFVEGSPAVRIPIVLRVVSSESKGGERRESRRTSPRRARPR